MVEIVLNLESERQGFQFWLPMYWLGSFSQEACDPSGKKEQGSPRRQDAKEATACGHVNTGDRVREVPAGVGRMGS